MSTPTPVPLPPWVEDIRGKYLAGEASVFVLHLNVFDQVLYEGRYYSVTDFLGRVLLWPTKRNIIVYDPAAGISLLRQSEELAKVEALRGARTPREVFPILEAILFSASGTALIMTYAGALVPAGEFHFLSEQDRINIVTLHRWSLSKELADKDNLVFLQTEMLSELSPLLIGNPRIAAIEVPLPDLGVRAEVIRKSDATLETTEVELLAKHTAGLRAVQIAALLTPRTSSETDDAERRDFIASLLGTGRDVSTRAEKLAGLTRGLRRDEIRHLINPDQPLPVPDPAHACAEVLALVHRRKREIIEKECVGLIEFVEGVHDLSAVGGNEHIKDELRRIAESIKAGERARIPMGLLFVGPMGTGKTFVAGAFVRESGLSAVKLKNFRSKWVGSTEANLEKVLSLVRSLGPIILIIDEGDRAFGGGDEEDGGTSSRVIARLKEFMSDPENRGRVLTVLMTNRPDKLDVDIKRAGRLDRKIPFFYAGEAQEIEQVLAALLRRHAIAHDMDWPRDRAVSEPLIGYSNADLEAVCLLAHDLAEQQSGRVTAEIFQQAVADYLPARDTRMLEYMELLAVFETSRRSLVPERLRHLSGAELNERLRALRSELRI
jgi:transitional endoplasmic reticulum ATPase